MWGEENGGEGERKKVVEGTEEREERDARLSVPSDFTHAFVSC